MHGCLEIWNFSFHVQFDISLVRAMFNNLASVKVKCVDIIYSCLEKGCQKKCIIARDKTEGFCGK